MTGGLSSVVSDPSLNGWATFLVYLAAAWRFWLVLAALLLLLGLTRQLDLQQLAANMMRALLRSDGVYGERSGLQLGLIVAIGIFGTMGLLIALMSLRRAEPSVLVALLGAAFLIIFTVIRTISLHDIDRILNHGVGLPRLRVNTLIEIGLLALIVIAGFAFGRGLKREGESARLRALSIQERQRILAEKRRSARS